jgi:hypothetical protein
MAGCSEGRVVVVDDSNLVVGIVSPSDVVRSVQVSGFRGWAPYGGVGSDLAAILRPKA